MIALIQRVSSAKVEVDNKTIGEISHGIMALIGVQKGDDSTDAQRLAERLIGYRIFPDAADKMNLSLKDTNGELLLVPQFTLAANTKKGTRPSFASAAPPDIGIKLFNELCDICEANLGTIATGEFGADMQVSLTNDGPVTLWLET